MVNGVCLQAQGRDAAKSGDGICIDSSANRVCLQAQNAMQRSDDESEKELECEIWNRRIGQSCRVDLGERRRVDEVSWNRRIGQSSRVDLGERRGG